MSPSHHGSQSESARQDEMARAPILPGLPAHTGNKAGLTGSNRLAERHSHINQEALAATEESTLCVFSAPLSFSPFHSIHPSHLFISPLYLYRERRVCVVHALALSLSLLETEIEIEIERRDGGEGGIWSRRDQERDSRFGQFLFQFLFLFLFQFRSYIRISSRFNLISIFSLQIHANFYYSSRGEKIQL